MVEICHTMDKMLTITIITIKYTLLIPVGLIKYIVIYINAVIYVNAVNS